MRHLVIGKRQKAPNFSAFHWSPHGCLITIGQHFVTTRVVQLPKRTETSLITKLDESRANHQLLQLCTVRTAWSDSDQAVRAVHSCISWFILFFIAHLDGCLLFSDMCCNTSIVVTRSIIALCFVIYLSLNHFCENMKFYSTCT